MTCNKLIVKEMISYRFRPQTDHKFGVKSCLTQQNHNSLEISKKTTKIFVFQRITASIEVQLVTNLLYISFIIFIYYDISLAIETLPKMLPIFHWVLPKC